MPQIIDGKKISTEIKDELRAQVAQLKEKGTEVTLAVIQVGNDPASSVYVGNKKKTYRHSKSIQSPKATHSAEKLHQ